MVSKALSYVLVCVSVLLGSPSIGWGEQPDLLRKMGYGLYLEIVAGRQLPDGLSEGVFGGVGGGYETVYDPTIGKPTISQWGNFIFYISKQDADFNILSFAILQGDFDEFDVQSSALNKATASGYGIYQETSWNGEEWITTERMVEISAEFEFQGEIETSKFPSGSRREGNFYEIKYRYRFGDILKSIRFGDLEFDDPGSFGFIEEAKQQSFVK